MEILCYLIIISKQTILQIEFAIGNQNGDRQGDAGVIIQCSIKIAYFFKIILCFNVERNRIFCGHLSNPEAERFGLITYR